MKFTIIACINNKKSLGSEGQLLYHIKNDLANFKRITKNQVVIYGRKTLESFPGAKTLPNRENIILTRDASYKPENAVICHSVEELLNTVKNYPDKELYVIGGSSVYQQFLDLGLIDTMILTEVDDDFSGDALFPEFDINEWKVKFETDWITQNTQYPYRYKVFKKI